MRIAELHLKKIEYKPFEKIYDGIYILMIICNSFMNKDYSKIHLSFQHIPNKWDFR